MDESQPPAKQRLHEFMQQLDDVCRFESDELMPVVLEAVGKLGALNRAGVSLIESALIELVELRRRAEEGDVPAADELERLVLALREASERVEAATKQLKGQHELQRESLEMSEQMLEYIVSVRELLIQKLWAK